MLKRRITSIEVIFICRLAYVPIPEKVNDTTLIQLFSYLEKKMGGNGNGLGWFEKGQPHILKGVNLKVEDIIKKIREIKPDNGILFHSRLASIGNINDMNCHPFLFDHSITAHNGHMKSIGPMKILMMEQGTWSADRVMASTDSEIIGYYINKYGFSVTEMFSGVIMTMFPKEIKIKVSGDLESLKINDTIIFSSEFPAEMGLKSDLWMGFENGTHLTIGDGNSTMMKGGVYNAKEEYLKKLKRYKK